MKQGFEAIKTLEFTKDDIEKFAECFQLIHHSPGRIRLRASKVLKEMIEGADSAKVSQFFDSAKALPMVKNIKINKLIGSVTIEYDSEAFEPKLWEIWLSGKNAVFVYERIQNIIKAL